MEHIAAIMVLIGCGDGGIDCRELPAPQPAYETVVACERQMEAALREASDSRPIVYGQCAEVDPALFDEDAVISWDFAENGELHIDVVATDTLYASRDVSPQSDY